jgi:hypothetical protein
MSLIAPAAIAFAVVLPAILLLYFLKIRRPEVPFSSTLLWRKAVRDRQASAPWQRLRFSWLLLLQLLAAATLVAALARPALSAQSTLSGHTIVLLQTSSTMQATDVTPSRFEVARGQVRDLLGKVGPSDRVTLVDLGPRPRIVAAATGDTGPIQQALEGLRPSNGGADLQQALALAASAAVRGQATRLLIFGDGITDRLRAAVSLPFEVDYRRVGVSGENLAITALTISAQQPDRTAVVRLQNFGRERRHADIEWRVDGRLADARAADLDPGAARDLSFSIPAGAGIVQAQLGVGDSLELDNTASGVARSPRTLHVVVVTPGNVFLEHALKLRSDLDVRTILPADYKFDPAVDLYLFDGIAPSPVPATPTWYLNPPQGVFATGAHEGVGGLRAGQAIDPLLQDVDLRDVHVARGSDLRATTFGGRVLLDSTGGPMALVREEPTRAVLFGFDLHASDLPLRTAFPILVDHLAAFLLPESVGPRAYHPDEPVLIAPLAGVSEVRVTNPSGHTETVAHGGGTLAPLAFSDTDALGIYTVEQKRGSEVLRSQFAVDAASERSQIAPRERLDLVASSRSTANRSGSELIEWWPWIAVAALALLSAEWLVFHRGI